MNESKPDHFNNGWQKGSNLMENLTNEIILIKTKNLKYSIKAKKELLKKYAHLYFACLYTQKLSALLNNNVPVIVI